MKSEVPYTIGYDIDRALLMLDGFNVVIDETSTPFEDKKEERTNHIPIVVRQLNIEECVHLTVARFK